MTEDKRAHHAEQARQWYYANIERARARSRESMRARRAADPVGVSEKTKAWREANKERIQEARRAWYEARPGYAKAQGRKWHVANPLRSLLTGARKRARNANVPFDLTIEDIHIPEVCPLLGIALVRGIGRGKVHAGSPSLDRIVPSLGYVRGNVWVISFRANAMKQDASLEEFLRVAEAWRAIDTSARIDALLKR